MKANIKQGSAEWHAWRNRGIGSSDAPIILGVSPYSTPYELWLEKVSGSKRKVNPWAARHGHDLEPEARLAYEASTGITMMPACLTHPDHEWMLASVDGIAFDQPVLIEIKCPSRETHAIAKEGRVPEHYYPQVQHQLAVAGAVRGVNEAHYFSYRREDNTYDAALVKVAPDEKYIQQLMFEELRFMELVRARVPPPFTDRDVIERDDDIWAAAAQSYWEAKEKAALAKQYEEEARSRLIAMCGDKSVRGGGFQVTRYYTKGRVKYDAIPQLKGVSLDLYREKGLMQYRISKDKSDETD